MASHTANLHLSELVLPSSPSEAALLSAVRGGSDSLRGHINAAAMISKALNAKSGIVLIAALATSAIGALPAVAGPERLAHVLISDVTQPPPGWVEFCARQPAECTRTTTAPQNL